MLVFSKDRCGTSKHTGRLFKKNEKVFELSKEFIMIHVHNERAKDKKFMPDGSYTPRIMFMRPDGHVYYDIKSGYAGFQYYISRMDAIIKGMETVIEDMKKINPNNKPVENNQPNN